MIIDADETFIVVPSLFVVDTAIKPRDRFAFRARIEYAGRGRRTLQQEDLNRNATTRPATYYEVHAPIPEYVHVRTRTYVVQNSHCFVFLLNVLLLFLPLQTQNCINHEQSPRKSEVYGQSRRR